MQNAPSLVFVDVNASSRVECMVSVPQKTKTPPKKLIKKPSVNGLTIVHTLIFVGLNVTTGAKCIVNMPTPPPPPPPKKKRINKKASVNGLT